MPTEAPYGAWVSPITAADLTTGAHPVGGGRFVGDEIWWSELRPNEGGRTAILRVGADGEPEVMLPEPWNARTRVHEYGGSCWLVTPEKALVFTNFADQRLYRLDYGSDTPVPLTPEGDFRYAEPQLHGDEIWCVRETYEGSKVTRDICAVSDAGVRKLIGGSDFLAGYRLSPDGNTLAWVAWDHPQMPWDGTELRVCHRNDDGSWATPRTILGSTTESVLQPEFVDNETLTAISDRSGWWNLYSLTQGKDPAPLKPMDAEFADALWLIGTTFYKRIDEDRIATVRTLGVDTLGILANGTLTDVDLGDISSVSISDVKGDQLLLTGGGPRSVSGLRLLDLGTGELTDIRLALDTLPDRQYLPTAEPRTFCGAGGRDVHAIVFPPHNPDFAAPAGELPPYVAYVHGGPTSRVSTTVDLAKAYFTSRGIGIIDVNYGGSTGYGREYRNRLRGQWGIVDVEDTVSAIVGLADSNEADRNRLAIMGGSAGGWTVLAALTGTDVFACGASYFGVAELLKFAEDTHDFESRYLDGLIGPPPEAHDLYVERAPLSHVDELSCPVLLLQGLDDPVVPPSQAELFRDAMIAKGIPHAYRPYAGESHGFRKAENIIDSKESELSFYGQVMGFTPPGVPVLELYSSKSQSAS